MKLLKRILSDSQQLVWPLAGIILLVSGCQMASGQRAAESDSAQARLVSSFIAAYNQKDTDSMLQHTHKDIEWIYTDGSGTVVQTRGTDALLEALAQYWQGLPSARSEVIWMNSSYERVAVHERAIWISEGVEKSQSALSVYGFLDGKIRRVWYFPAEVPSTKRSTAKNAATENSTNK